MGRTLRTYICLMMLVLLCGCGTVDNQRGDVGTVNNKMTEEEIALMADVFGEEDRMRSGDLFDFHVEALQQLRAGNEYLAKKYPGCDVKIISFSPATQLSPQANFLLQAKEINYTMTLNIVEGEYVCADDYYGALIGAEYDKYVGSVLEAGGVTAEVYTSFSALLGDTVGKDTDVDEFLTVASKAMRKTDIFVVEPENREGVKEEIQTLIRNVGLYGTYVVYFVDIDQYSDRESMEKNRSCWEYLTFNCY